MNGTRAADSISQSCVRRNIIAGTSFKSRIFKCHSRRCINCPVHRCIVRVKGREEEHRRGCFRRSPSIRPHLQFLSMLNERNDGPVVHRPSSRLIGMLIASRADLGAISNERTSERTSKPREECTWKGKGLRCKIARFLLPFSLNVPGGSANLHRRRCN